MHAALPSGVQFLFYTLPRGALASSLPLGYNTATPFGGEYKAIIKNRYSSPIIFLPRFLFFCLRSASSVG